MISLEWLVASKNASDVWPASTVTYFCTGLNDQGRVPLTCKEGGVT